MINLIIIFIIVQMGFLKILKMNLKDYIRSIPDLELNWSAVAEQIRLMI